jgi:hypothetical protein
MDWKELGSNRFVRITFKILKYTTITIIAVPVSLFLMLLFAGAWNRLSYEDTQHGPLEQCQGS